MQRNEIAEEKNVKKLEEGKEMERKKEEKNTKRNGEKRG